LKAAITASLPATGGMFVFCDACGDFAGAAGGVGFGAAALGAALAGSGVDELTFVERGRGVVVDEFEFCAFICCARTKSRTMMVVLLIMCCPRLFR
jgi:hypothetical protein